MGPPYHLHTVLKLLVLTGRINTIVLKDKDVHQCLAFLIWTLYSSSSILGVNIYHFGNEWVRRPWEWDDTVKVLRKRKGLYKVRQPHSNFCWNKIGPSQNLRKEVEGSKPNSVYHARTLNKTADRTQWQAVKRRLFAKKINPMSCSGSDSTVSIPLRYLEYRTEKKANSIKMKMLEILIEHGRCTNAAILCNPQYKYHLPQLFLSVVFLSI